jgi:hypothetical protein
MAVSQSGLFSDILRRIPQTVAVPRKGKEMTITVDKSWHTQREWFVRMFGSYRGEVVYYPATMLWHACPWRAFGRLTGRWFEEMQDAIDYTATAQP